MCKEQKAIRFKINDVSARKNIYERDVYMTFFNTKVVYIYIKRKSSKLILILLLETTKCIEKLMIKPGKLASVDSPPQVF